MTSPLGPAAPGPEVETMAPVFLMGIAIFINSLKQMKSYSVVYDPIRCVVSYTFMVLIWDSGDMVVKWLWNGCEMVVKWLRNGCEMVVKWLWNGCVFLWFVNPKCDWWLWCFFYWSFFKSTLEWILDDTILRVEISGCSQHAGYWRHIPWWNMVVWRESYVETGYNDE